MNKIEGYTIRTVKVLDCYADQDLGTDERPKFEQKLVLLLQDIDNEIIIRTVLKDKDIRHLTGLNIPLSSKEMIDLSNRLKNFPDKMKMYVPDNLEARQNTDIVIDDLIKSKSINKNPQVGNNQQNKSRNNYYKRKKRKNKAKKQPYTT